MRALQPAKVKEVHLDDLTGTATVVVHDFQLSLAIGKEGQNARLAARLTGWRIDIKSETQIAEEEAYANQEWAEGEWVENEAGEMVWQPAEGGEAVSAEQWSLGETADEADGAGGGRGRPARTAHRLLPGAVRPAATGEVVGAGDGATSGERSRTRALRAGRASRRTRREGRADQDLRRVPDARAQPIPWSSGPPCPTGRWSSTGTPPAAAPGSARSRRPEASATVASRRPPIGTPLTGPSRQRSTAELVEGAESGSRERANIGTGSAIRPAGMRRD